MSEDVRIEDIDIGININMSEEIPIEVIAAPNLENLTNIVTGSSSESISKVSFQEKEILALRTNGSLLQEKIKLLENASKKNKGQLRMKEVELDFMHKEND